MEGHQPRQVPPHKASESEQDSLRPLTDEEILAASRDLRLVTIEDNPCLWRYDYPWGEEDFFNAAPRLW